MQRTTKGQSHSQCHGCLQSVTEVNFKEKKDAHRGLHGAVTHVACKTVRFSK